VPPPRIGQFEELGLMKTLSNDRLVGTVCDRKGIATIASAAIINTILRFLATGLIRCRLLCGFDDENLNLTLRRFEFQSEL
jgi:hypothetical protein